MPSLWMTTFALAAVPFLLAVTSPASPTARFVVQCQPQPSLSCTVASTSLGRPNKFTWLWGDGRSETHAASSATNTWSVAGTYTVTLTVTDSIGGQSTTSQLVAVPMPGSHTDTVTVLDTVTIHDTVVVHDTILLMPPAGEIRAELPRVYLLTSMPITTGAHLTVSAGGNLQAAIDSAKMGDVIELANNGTWVGNYILPAKTGSGWIVIRPQNMTVIPAEGFRLAPLQAGRLPLIRSPSNLGAITTQAGAHHYRLIGLEVTVSSDSSNTGLVRLGTGYETTLAQLPHDLVLDRMYVHGSPTGNLRRAVILNGASSAVIDSYLSECHERGSDSQALGGWNGSGPFKIVNNYLEAASENIIFGGTDPIIPGLIPSDIEIRRNHLTKQLAWLGAGWQVKNLFELKNAQRVLVEANVIENNWADAQSGSAINLKSVNQSGTCTWCVTRDVTFRLNLIRNTGSGFNISEHDSIPALAAERITIVNNVMDGINVAPFAGDGRGILLNGAPIDIVFVHNTILEPTLVGVAFGGPIPTPPVRLVIRDNIIGGGLYGVKGPGISTFNTFRLFAPTFAGNVMVTLDPTGYPPGNYFAPTRAVATSTVYPGTDRINSGANVQAVMRATAGVVQ